VRLSLAEWQNKKILITGLANTGKTHLAHEISKLFTCLIYTRHKDDIDKFWKVDPNIYIARPKNFVRDYPLWCVIAKQMKAINCFLTDDADALFKTHFDTSEELADLSINNRHYGKTLVWVSRRAQDIPAKVYNQCEILCLFSIDAPQAITLLNKYYEGLGDQVRALPWGSHEFIYKHVGQEPLRLKV
jgi:hypothetical protein